MSHPSWWSIAQGRKRALPLLRDNVAGTFLPRPPFSSLFLNPLYLLRDQEGRIPLWQKSLDLRHCHRLFPVISDQHHVSLRKFIERLFFFHCKISVPWSSYVWLWNLLINLCNPTLTLNTWAVSAVHDFALYSDNLHTPPPPNFSLGHEFRDLVVLVVALHIHFCLLPGIICLLKRQCKETENYIPVF